MARKKKTPIPEVVCLPNGENAIKLPGMNPVTLRLDDDEVGRRFALGDKEPLIRAVGAHDFDAESPPYVLDATAGLGRDTALLLRAGCRVIACERESSLTALWNDVVRPGFEFLNDDAVNVLMAFAQSSQERPSVVYLDPMFPVEKKGAQVSRESQVMRAVAKPDEEGALRLLECALLLPARTVVKRKKGAAALVSERPELERSGRAPSFSLDAGQVRYDVYGA